MEELEEIMDNEFSTEVINRLNRKYDSISKLISDHMDSEAYEKIEEKFQNLLVDSSKDYFVQGFLRSMAAANSKIP